MSVFVFKARAPRRMPDPVSPTPGGRERHVFHCAVLDVPEGLPLDPNPRTQDDVDRGIYRDVKRSLFNQDCTPNTFHLKNKGITLLAESVAKVDGEDTLRVTFASGGHGIIDGGHTYKLIVQNQNAIRASNASDESQIEQFVKIEVLTGVPDSLVTEIAGGLNTAVQVQRMSLADLDDRFDWIKDELQGSSILNYIAFKQNEPKEYDVRDVIRLLDLFNVFDFPNSGSEYPIRAYTAKESVLKHYLGTGKSNTPNAINYKRLRPILKEILMLHDIISSEARERYNDGGGKRAGRLKFVDGPSPADKKYQFRFIDKEAECRLSGGALMPLLGAFRAAVLVDKQTGGVSWSGDFDNVVRLWRETGRELMEATQETSEELGRNPNAIGKSKKHWAYLHNSVIKHLYPR